MLGFFARVVAAFVVFTLAWWKLADWLCAPAIHLAAAALQDHAHGWLAQTLTGPNVLKAITYPLPAPPRPFPEALLMVEHATDNTNGLPLFLALLAGTKSRRFWLYAPLGFLVLSGAQAFYMAFEILRDLLRLGPAAIEAMRIAAWQQYWIKAAYVFSGVILPVLLPVALWALFERDALRAMMQRANTLLRAAPPAP